MPEPTIDVSKIVEARLLRIGIADPNSISQLRRSSRPGTSMSNSLALIDETRAGIVDEPVLGWSSGLPAPIGTPSNDNGGYLTPLDSASLSNTWKRVPTPNTPDKPSPFSPMLQSAGAAVPFSPALAPLKEGKESHVRKENLPSDVRMMSRESVRQVTTACACFCLPRECVRVVCACARRLRLQLHGNSTPTRVRMLQQARACSGASARCAQSFPCTHMHIPPPLYSESRPQVQRWTRFRSVLGSRRQARVAIQRAEMRLM